MYAKLFAIKVAVIMTKVSKVPSKSDFAVSVMQ